MLSRSALAFASLVALPGLAFAQAGVPEGTSEPGDIVVTAQKRVEGVRDIPLSISVLDAEQLSRAHITDYGDLARNVAGLSFTNTGASGLSRIALRGVASASGAATVGVYLDDVALSFPNQSFTGTTLPRLFDLERVEVLRGPQGTLYGDSSLGGTLRFITSQPELGQISGYANGQLAAVKGGGTDYEVSGAVNLPLGSRAALRIAGVSGRQSGFIDHVDATGAVDRQNVDAERYHAVRATLLVEATDWLKLTPTLQWQYSKTDDSSVFNLSLPRFQRANQVLEPSRDTLIVPSLTAEASFGDYTLTSITSYTKRKFDRRLDATVFDSEYVASAIDPDYGAPYDRIAALPGVLANVDRITNWSEELRLASPGIKAGGRSYEWQIGAYLNSLKAQSLDDEYVYGLNDAVTGQFGTSVQSIIGYAAPDDLLGYFHSDRTLKQIAGFAQGSLMIVPKLKATVGVRQVKAWTESRMAQGGWLADGTPASEKVKSDESPFTPKFALDYAVSRELSLYASATKGFRLGGQNNTLPSFCGRAITSIGLTAVGVKSYGSDTIWAYEVGGKAGFFGNRLRVNASAYRIDWSNIQQQLRLASCGYVITANAGDARSQGGELEIAARVTDALTLNVTGGVTDAHITEEAAGSTAKVGQKVLGVPNKTLMLGVDYDRRLSERLALHATMNWNYTGESRGSFTVTDSDYVREDYWVGDLDAGVDIDNLTLGVFVKNIADDQTVIQKPSILFIRQGLTVRPRTIGASLRVRY
ncbi:TonB-dependent receptor [Sphingomonas sp. PL-96]|nr:TonB-dependent receptor [Sphingomonas sp. PL-96]